MTRRLDVLIVGAGVMGSAYAQAIAGGSLRFRARVSAICDRDRAAAERLAATCGAAAFTDLDAALAAAPADLAYVAVPDHLHREPFIRCIEHGIPCLVEKPLATTVADAEAMRNAARAARVHAEVNFSNRWNPALLRVREAVDSGSLGEVAAVSARLSNAIQYPLENLRWASHTTSGWFLLSHVFDLVHWLTGARARELTATGRMGRLAAAGVEAPDVIQSLVRYDGGFSGLFESAWVLPRSLPSGVDFKLQVIGTDGVAAIDLHDQSVHVATAERLTYPPTLDWTEARIAAFLDRVADRAVPEDLLDDGVENTRMLVALHEAIATGAPTAVSG
jgi:predicted dehydrogenase